MYASWPHDWLKEAYTKSHEPGDGEPYSINAEARDLFNTKIDLVETGKNLLKSKDLWDAAKDLWDAIKDTEDIQNAINNIKRDIASIIAKKERGEVLSNQEKQELQDLQNALNNYQSQLSTAQKNLGQVISENVSNADSIFVRMTRFLMRIAVVLAVPVLLFIWVKLILAFGDEWKMKEALKQVWYVLWWLFLALMSVMLIYLVTSLTRSSVDSFTGWFIFISSHVYNL